MNRLIVSQRIIIILSNFIENRMCENNPIQIYGWPSYINLVYFNRSHLYIDFFSRNCSRSHIIEELNEYLLSMKFDSYYDDNLLQPEFGGSVALKISSTSGCRRLSS